MLRYFFIVSLCFGFGLFPAFSQTPSPADQTQTTNSEEERKPSPRKRKKRKAPEYDPAIKGHPYFGTGSWAAGSVWYDGALLPALPLRYDLVKDEVVLRDEDPDNPDSKLRLLREKVDSFTVAGHTFVRLAEGKKGKSAKNFGFYENLLEGPVAVWAKREKYIYKQQTYQRIQPMFVAEDRFLVEKDGKLHVIKNGAGLLKVFRDRKKELKAFIENENIDLRENPEDALVRVVRHYNALSSGSR